MDRQDSRYWVHLQRRTLSSLVPTHPVSTSNTWLLNHHFLKITPLQPGLALGTCKAGGLSDINHDWPSWAASKPTSFEPALHLQFSFILLRKGLLLLGGITVKICLLPFSPQHLVLFFPNHKDSLYLQIFTVIICYWLYIYSEFFQFQLYEEMIRNSCIC